MPMVPFVEVHVTILLLEILLEFSCTRGQFSLTILANQNLYFRVNDKLIRLINLSFTLKYRF